MNKTVFLIGIIILAFAFPLLEGQKLSAQTILYVSPSGNDEASGSINQPLQSIARAQKLMRQGTGEQTIMLRQGTYRLSEPLCFTSADGHQQKSLCVRAYPGEQVTLTGGELLQLQWKPYRDGIVQAKIMFPIDIDMLVVNGNIRHMARYPNFDSTAVRFNGTSADATSPHRVKGWKHPEGGFLHVMHAHDWGDFHYRILGVNADGTLRLEGGHQNNRQMGLSPHNRMVENIFEELDTPGEWYFDRYKSILYYYPLPTENPVTATFEVPRLKHLVELQGTESNPVRHITLRDIHFTLSVRTFMEHYEPLLRSDWTVYRGGAIRYEGAESCTLHGCDFTNLGGNAIFYSCYNRYHRVQNCHFTRIGASAILFVGDTAAVRSPSFEYGQAVPYSQMDLQLGPKNNNYPADCFIQDNLIHAIGLFEKQVTAIELSMCHRITVAHNSIYDVPRAGINVSEGTWGGHIIEYNDIFDTVKETGDHGAFNSWGRDRFWHPNYGEMCHLTETHPELILADVLSPIVIRHNRLRCERGWDIDLDDGSSCYHIYNNLLLNGGIKLREGFYRRVENNILVNNTFHPHVWFKRSGDIFRGNIVMSAYQPINLQGWGTEVDYNIFTNRHALAEAQKGGTDTHSIYEPITFRAPKQGDYRINPIHTAAFRLGFQNFDMNCFGVQSVRLKSLARTPQMSLPMVLDETVERQLINWQGWSVKNLETLGERSATGMDAERGVYVVTLVAYDSPMKDFIQANDVILKLGETDINNLDDLQEATKRVLPGKTQEMVIFRDQKENRITIPVNILSQK